jgi:hypothetical protein
MKKRLIILTISLILGLLPRISSAATIALYPSLGEYFVGQTIAVSVYVSSEDQSINAVSGIIHFSQDKLEVLSLSEKDSIFSFWISNPSFSNTNSTIDFKGIIFNPGFIGKKGKIITIYFKTKSAGSANIDFSSKTVLANDGLGTEILTVSEVSKFNIIEPKEISNIDLKSIKKKKANI